MLAHITLWVIILDLWLLAIRTTGISVIALVILKQIICGKLHYHGAHFRICFDATTECQAD